MLVYIQVPEWERRGKLCEQETYAGCSKEHFAELYTAGVAAECPIVGLRFYVNESSLTLSYYPYWSTWHRYLKCEDAG